MAGSDGMIKEKGDTRFFGFLTNGHALGMTGVGQASFVFVRARGRRENGGNPLLAITRPLGVRLRDRPLGRVGMRRTPDHLRGHYYRG